MSMSMRDLWELFLQNRQYMRSVFVILMCLGLVILNANVKHGNLPHGFDRDHLVSVSVDSVDMGQTFLIPDLASTETDAGRQSEDQEITERGEEEDSFEDEIERKKADMFDKIYESLDAAPLDIKTESPPSVNLVEKPLIEKVVISSSQGAVNSTTKNVDADQSKLSKEKVVKERKVRAGRPPPAAPPPPLGSNEPQCFPRSNLGGGARVQDTIVTQATDQDAKGGKSESAEQLRTGSLTAPDFCIETATMSTIDETKNLGSCAVVFPTRLLFNSGAGPAIDAHDNVFRINAHNAPNRRNKAARDFGWRTSVRTLTVALILGSLKHSVLWTQDEIWLLFSGCSHAKPEPWCVRLRDVLKNWRPVKALDFQPQVAHRSTKCLSTLKRNWKGQEHKYQHHPTTGFITTLFAMQQCSCVTVFGICDQSPTCEHALHWSGHSDKFGWRDPAHDFTLEHLALILMTKAKPDHIRLWVPAKNAVALSKEGGSRFDVGSRNLTTSTFSKLKNAIWPWSKGSGSSSSSSKKVDQTKAEKTTKVQSKPREYKQSRDLVEKHAQLDNYISRFIKAHPLLAPKSKS